MSYKGYKDLIDYIVSFCKSNCIEADKVAGLFAMCRIDVLEKLTENLPGIIVLKRDGRIEAFDERKLYASIASASDEINQSLNSSDINHVVKEITEKIFLYNHKVVTSQSIKETVLESLTQLGFIDIRESMKNYLRD